MDSVHCLVSETFCQAPLLPIFNLPAMVGLKKHHDCYKLTTDRCWFKEIIIFNRLLKKNYEILKEFFSRP